jgi:MFS family permease
MSTPPSPPAPPQTTETPHAPQPRAAFDLFLSPDRGWFRALRHPNFRLFWTGNFVSNIGSWMQNVAQGWLVYQLTDSPLWLGLVGFAQQVPSLIFSLPGGVIADRISRRKVLLTTQTLMMVFALALAALVSLRLVTVEHILLLAFLAGTVMALNAPNHQAAVRDLVQAEDTLNAIALNSIQFNFSRVLGPSVAGFIIAAAGVAACFYLNAMSYVVLLFVLARVEFPPHHEREQNSVRSAMAESFRYVWVQRHILILISLVALVSTFGLPYLVMMPAFARDVLHVGARGYGYLVACAGLGALAGGIWLARLEAHHRRGPVVLSAALTFFTAVLAFSISRNAVLSGALLAVVGASLVNCVATVNSLVQTLVPDHIRGRILSLHTMAFLGFTPLGSLLVGALAERSSPPLALALSSGFALLLTAVIALSAPTIRRLQ